MEGARCTDLMHFCAQGSAGYIAIPLTYSIKAECVSSEGRCQLHRPQCPVHALMQCYNTLLIIIQPASYVNAGCISSGGGRQLYQPHCPVHASNATTHSLSPYDLLHTLMLISNL